MQENSLSTIVPGTKIILCIMIIMAEVGEGVVLLAVGVLLVAYIAVKSKSIITKRQDKEPTRPTMESTEQNEDSVLIMPNRIHIIKN